MRKRGSITVFLALTFGLIFSLVLTALEGARLQGAGAYLSMLSELAGDSFLAHYYYPLFQEYRLFGVYAGNENGYFSEEKVVNLLEENMEYGAEQEIGGLLKMYDTRVELLEDETLISGAGEHMLAQIKEQTVFDGLSLALSQFFKKEMFQDAAVAGEIYKKQEETMAELAPVAEELLRLMELTDGICTGDAGLKFDENGRLQVADVFIKQILPMNTEDLKGCYENKEVAAAVAQNLYSVGDAATTIFLLMEECMRLERELFSLAAEIDSRNGQMDSISKELDVVQLRIDAYLAKKETGEDAQNGETKEEYDRDVRRVQELKNEMSQAQEAYREVSAEQGRVLQNLDRTAQNARMRYDALAQKINKVIQIHKEALTVLDKLEKKQLSAKTAVTTYEVFLQGKQETLSEELYQVFEQELMLMKQYLGLEEQGYVVKHMRETVEQNLEILGGMKLNGFSGWNFSEVKNEMQQVKTQMIRYSGEHLWFTYGAIVASEHIGQNVLGMLQDFLAEGVLALVGVEEDSLSDRKLTGQDLPSASLKKKDLLSDLLACMESIAGGFQSQDMEALLNGTLGKAVDAVALELYCMKYFHCHGEVSPYTKLNYEHEYILHGEQEDKTNLFYVVLQLVAVRTLLRVVAILKNPERMTELQSFSAGVAGLTGIPVLLAVVKYTVLLLWSVEEAFVEVAALLQGKRVAVLDEMGYITFSEVFRFGKTMIETKAKQLTDSVVGASYRNYLTLLSMLVPVKEKLYRTMDLIQENLRYRYADDFRIRNVVTGAEFISKAKLEEKFNLGIYTRSVYKLEWKEDCSY